MELSIDGLLKEARNRKATDLHLTVGLPAMVRINGHLVSLGSSVLTPDNTIGLARQLLTGDYLKRFEEKEELDFAYTLVDGGRFRVNLYRQRGNIGVAIRVLNSKVPTVEELGLPAMVTRLTQARSGLILVTGPAGCGKSTTLAAMIGQINRERKCHILTLEDPIEYLYQPGKSMINQREIGVDSSSFAVALRAALRQDPDVILVGEMRDPETIATAITAAETGHLVLSTLHTGNAPRAIDRVIDAFPHSRQEQVRMQLANTLAGIIAQRLLGRWDGRGQVPAVEVLVGTPAIRNLIREGKSHQIYSIMQAGSRYGMQLMDESLRSLYEQGLIAHETAIDYAVDPEYLSRVLNRLPPGAGIL